MGEVSTIGLDIAKSARPCTAIVERSTHVEQRGGGARRRISRIACDKNCQFASHLYDSALRGSACRRGARVQLDAQLATWRVGDLPVLAYFIFGSGCAKVLWDSFCGVDSCASDGCFPNCVRRR